MSYNMPNVIPPIVSSSPPPIDPVEDENDDDDEEDDDDFGNFAAAPDFQFPDPTWKVPNLIIPDAKFSIEENKQPSFIASDTSPSKTADVELPNEDDSLESLKNNSQGTLSSSETQKDGDSYNSYSPEAENSPSDDLEDKNSKTGSISEHLSNQNVFSDAVVSAVSEEQHETVCNELTEDAGSSYFSRFQILNSEPESDFNGTTQSAVDNSDSENYNCKSENLTSEGEPDKYSSFPPSIINSPNKSAAFKINEKIITSENLRDFKIEEGNITNSVEVVGSFQDIRISETDPQGTESLEENNLVTQHASTVISEAVVDSEDEFVAAMVIPNILMDFNGKDDVCDEDWQHSLNQTSNENCDNFTRSTDNYSNEQQRKVDLSDEINQIEKDDIKFDSSEPSYYNNEILESERTANKNSTESSEYTSQIMSSSANNNINELNFFKDNNTILKKDGMSEINSEEFNQFADFSKVEAGSSKEKLSNGWLEASVPSNVNILDEDTELDDFDDFESAEFQSAETTIHPQPTSTSTFYINTPANASEILKQVFPFVEESMENLPEGGSCCGIALNPEESPVWQGLRDLESTPSLLFQWPGSQSNRALLGALNIDARNILFGPKWNTVVPRFAANLGLSPLEPVRASHAQTQPDLQPMSDDHASKSSGPVDGVPAAQFDWSDSGLINPLDASTHSSLLDIDLLATFDNLASCSSTSMSASPTATVCRGVSISKSSNNGAAPKTLQVDQLASNSVNLAENSNTQNRDPNLSPEAVKVLNSLPELAFLSAKMLMFPMQNDIKANKL